MSVEKDTLPVPSGDPFYDALIKRLWMDDDLTRYYDALYFTGSTEQLEGFTLTDFNIMGLKEAPPIPLNAMPRHGGRFWGAASAA